MKKLIVFLTALAVIFTATASFASNWVEVDRNDDTIFSIDLDSVKDNGTTFRVWEKQIYRTAKVQKKRFGASYALLYYEFEMNEASRRIISYTLYDKNGNFIYSGGESYNYEFYPPGSIGEAIWQIGKSIVVKQRQN